MERLILGALAGLSATTAMTAAMRHLWPLLAPRHRYPLPPREIVDAMRLPPRGRKTRLAALLAHFGFGALAGAGYATLPTSVRRNGILYGLAVWGASYLGWLPAAGILVPATDHPRQRNLLMLAAHVVWGAALAANLRELESAEKEFLARGPALDARATDRYEARG